jgi:hypothetical protein
MYSSSLLEGNGDSISSDAFSPLSSSLWDIVSMGTSTTAAVS